MRFVTLLLVLFPLLIHAEVNEIRAALNEGRYEEAERLLVQHGAALDANETREVLRDVSWRTVRVRASGYCATGAGMLAAAVGGTATLLVCNVASYVLPLGIFTGALTGVTSYLVGTRYSLPRAAGARHGRDTLDRCRALLARHSPGT